jgi:predicted RNase H-related nuclease YkuK (DUF458 family)
MTTTQERNDDPLTFEKVWEMFQEIGRKQAETDRIVKENAGAIKETRESIRATDRQIQETWESIRATGRQMKETDKRVGELSNRFGDMVESMVVPNLVARFNELGYVFEDTSPNKEINDLAHSIFCEVDAHLENAVCVMAVETKVKPSQHDVDDHIKRLEKLRTIANYRKDKRKYYGAVAGVVMSKEVKAYILSRGFFAIEPSGETFLITPPMEPDKPRAW